MQAGGTAVWPDGTVTARYGFRHALYQELLYERVPVSRRVRWHQQIGTRLEVAFGLRAGEMAAELAVHFEHGRDYDRAVKHCSTRRRPLSSATHIVKRLRTCGGP